MNVLQNFHISRANITWYLTQNKRRKLKMYLDYTCTKVIPCRWDTGVCVFISREKKHREISIVHCISVADVIKDWRSINFWFFQSIGLSHNILQCTANRSVCMQFISRQQYQLLNKSPTIDHKWRLISVLKLIAANINWQLMLRSRVLTMVINFRIQDDII